MKRLLLPLLAVLGCAAQGPQTYEACRARARNGYRACLNPEMTRTGERFEPTRQDPTESCVANYQQALDQCGLPPRELPPMDISRTSTRSADDDPPPLTYP